MKKKLPVSRFLFLLIPAALLIGSIFYVKGSHSQPDAAAQEDQHNPMYHLMEQIGALKDFTYKTEVFAEFPTGEKDKMEITVAVDSTHQRLFYDSKIATYLIVGDYLYKADHDQKTVSVFSVRQRDAKMKGAAESLKTAIFDQSGYKVLMDSLMIKHAKIVREELGGPEWRYWLTFPGNNSLKSMYIAFNPAENIPRKVSMESFTPDARFSDNNGVKGTSMHVICTGYSRVLPDSLFDTHRFFDVQGNKVVATRFRNYKLLTPRFQ